MAKIKRRSAATKALDELSKLAYQASNVLSQTVSGDVVADYAMRIGGAKYFVDEMMRVIDAAQKSPEVSAEAS